MKRYGAWVAVGLFAACGVNAQNRYWVGGDGNWTEAANWSATDGGAGGAGVPVTGENVYLRSTSGSDKTVLYNETTAPSLASLELNATGAGSIVVTQAQHRLRVVNNGYTYIGKTGGGRGQFVQSGGTNIFGGFIRFRLGEVAGATGTYHLVNGGLSSGGAGNQNEMIGIVGTGFFVQDGGLHMGGTDFAAPATASADIYLGSSVGGQGTYTMNGGKLLFRWVNCGQSGRGTFVQNGGTNILHGNQIALQPASWGYYELNGGRREGRTYVGVSGTGVLTQTGGVLGGDAGIGSSGIVIVGQNAGSAGTYNMQGGICYPYYVAFAIGYGGRGTCNQSGGTINWTATKRDAWLYNGFYVHPVMAQFTNSYGVYNLSGGELRAYNLIVGMEGTGVVHHTGGTLALGNSGYWRQWGRGDLILGFANLASGAFYLGDAATSGVLTNLSSADTGALIVRDRPGTKGLFRGWGAVFLSQNLVNNGRVMADGYGTDRTLDLSRFALVTNSIDNGADEINGWYAVDGGQLALPPVTVAAGSSTVNWGEAAADASIDLVNSVRVAFTTLSAGADKLDIKLLAPDRADVQSGLENTVGVWDISLPNRTFASATLTFRYDAVRAAAIGRMDLRVFRHTGTVWQDVTAPGGLDTGARTITTKPVSSLSQFAIMAFPFGTVISVL